MILKSIALFFVLFSSQVKAQNFNVNGNIKSIEGEPLSAEIKVNSKIIYSDSLGKFLIENIEVGNQKIEVSKNGYYTKILTFSVLSSQINYLEVELSPLLVNLGKVSVSSRQNKDLVNQLDIQLRPLNSSQDILRMVPGLFIAQHAGGGKAEQIFLRGFDVDHGTDFAIFVDGIPVNMPSHAHGQGYADLHFLIPETVKQLEVNKGPHSTFYGDLATAGSGEFRTLDQFQNNEIKMSVGMFGTYRLVGLFNLLGNKPFLTKRKESLILATEYNYTNSYFQSKQHFSRANVFLKYQGMLNSKNKVGFTVSNFYSQWDASGQIPDRKVLDGTISRYGSIDSTEGGKTGRLNINLTHDKTINSNLFFKQQAYFSRYDFSLFSNFTFFLNDSINGDQIGQTDKRNLLGYNNLLRLNSTIFNKKVITSVGSGLRYDNADLQLNSTKFREFLGRKVYGKLNQLNTWVFLDENIYFSSKLRFNLGTRLDVYNFNFKNYLFDTASGNKTKAIASPKLNVFYTINKNIELFAKSGFGFHSNDARAVVVGQLETTLAKAFGNELGAIFKPMKKILINVAFWTLDLESELVYVGDEGIVEANGASRRTGIDLGVRYQINKNLFSDFDININKGRLIDEPEGNNRIPLAPNFTSIGGLTYKASKGFSGSIRYRFIGDRPAIEDNSIVAKGYFLTDLLLNYQIKKLNIGVSVENLMNQKWNEAQFATESRLQNETNSVNELHYTPGIPFNLKMSLSYIF